MRVDNEWKIISRNAVVAYFEFLPYIFLEVLRKSTKHLRIVVV
jgi:hypothetical protein